MHETSRLLRLPAELRSRIFQLALKHEHDAEIDICYHAVDPNSITLEEGREDTRPDPNALALTATCKQIRRESVSFFYSVHSFCLRPRIETLAGMYLEFYGETPSDEAAAAQLLARALSPLHGFCRSLQALDYIPFSIPFTIRPDFFAHADRGMTRDSWLAVMQHLLAALVAFKADATGPACLRLFFEFDAVQPLFPPTGSSDPSEYGVVVEVLSDLGSVNRALWDGYETMVLKTPPRRRKLPRRLRYNVHQSLGLPESDYRELDVDTDEEG